MVGKLSDQESALLHAVAYWLREQMLSQLNVMSPAPDLLHDLAQSNYEISCAALERVGLLALEGLYWRVSKPSENRPALAASCQRDDLDHLLDGLACQSYYADDLYRHHYPVTPTEHALQEVCVAMVACGYMEATSRGTFEWTDDFGPWLVRRAAWDLDEFEPASPEEVIKVLETIPEEARERLAGSHCRYKPEFARCFFAQWIDGKWEEREWRDVPNDDWDLNLASGLYAELHNR